MTTPLTITGPTDVAGVLLAGGLSRRFGGGDKCLRTLGGTTLLQHVARRAAPQVGTLILNAGGDAARFPDLGLEVVADVIDGAQGPLAGVLTGMEWAARHAPHACWLATFATDAPFMPVDLVARLMGAALRDGADIALAASNGRVHPVFALWSLRLRDDLRHALVTERERKVMAWVDRHRAVRVEFETQGGDPFFNINTPEDLAEAETIGQGMRT